ncbi:MAG: D-alanyl-D-alanine endopeptidase [Burkholderiaceae bacterium]|nr:D-alanyl-D-alanine endopeptidase [Burkholderiaceae bacterium]
MHHAHRTAVSRFIKLLGLFCVSAALVAPAAAHAGERKKATVKKEQVSSAKSKRAAAPRKAAASTKPVRITAKMAKAPTRVAYIPSKPSFGQMAGLHEITDPLELKSSVALVIDQDTHEVLLSKNDHAVLPIASLTKLMTGMIISQAKLPMDEPITITQDDVDTEKGSRSRLTVGTTLTRGEMLHLALMSSENRAAHALGRTYPGGLGIFVTQMNTKARLLGMTDTRYVEPTGLSSRNQSSARDLATLVNVAHGDPLLRELSTSPGYEVAVGSRTLQYNNTNGLVKNPSWEIGLQKTGYISEAGRCLVMQTQVAGRKLIMVFLDSAGKFSRLGDAERVRQWVETLPALPLLPVTPLKAARSSNG